MAIEYKGDDFIYAVEIPATTEPVVAAKTIRPFNQTGGSTTIEADSVDLDTKDKSGSDYGKISQSVSLEGILTDGDEFIAFIKKAIREKQFVKIYEINTRTKEAESGMYMISSFERSFSNGDFATYTLEGELNGAVNVETLEEIPTGAPAGEEA